MKINVLFTLFLGLIFSTSHAQQSRQVNVRNVVFNLNAAEKVIEINYEIEYNIPQDSVYILVQNKKGGKYKPTALRGDVGLGVKEGGKKKIVWDFIADSLRINEEIGVTVLVKQFSGYASKAEPSVVENKPEPIAKNEEPKAEKKSKVREKPKPEIAKVKPISPPKEKGKLNMTSFLIFGAGLVGGGYLISDGLKKNSTASQYYTVYKAANWNQSRVSMNDFFLDSYSNVTANAADKMLAIANDKKKTANLMLYSGIGLVVVDAVLMIPRLRRKPEKKLTFRPNYNFSTNAVLFSFNYNIK